MPKPKRHIRLLTVLILLFQVVYLEAKEFPKNYNWAEILAESNKSKKLDLIAEAARYNSFLAANTTLADSLCMYAIEIAQSSKDLDLVNKAISIFFDNADLRNNRAYALAIVNPLLDAKDLKERWQGNIYLSRIYEFNYADSLGLVAANNAIEIAQLIGDTLKKGIGFYQRAHHLQFLSGRKVDALNNFLKAKDIFLLTNAEDYFVNLCLELSMFYVGADAYDKSQVHLLEGLKVFNESTTLDSILGLNLQVQRVYNQYLLDPDHLDEKEILSQIAWCIRQNYNVQKRDYLTIYRTRLISKENYGGLYEFYQVLFPQEFQLIKESNSELYFRMKAYFKEYQGDLDSASYYWNKCINVDYIVKDKNRKTNLYVRFAEYLHRIGNTLSAINYYQLAYDTAVSINSPIYVYRSSVGLDSMFRYKGDYVRAYEWRKKATEIKAAIDKDNEEEKLLLTQVIYNSERDREQQAIKMKNVQRGFLGVMSGLIIVLILSIVIYFQFRQTSKQKKRSDELLLNILPEETAAELKEKGRTVARKYSDVTIVFADIVGFSKVAETLEPGELVEEIDRYFRAFDDLTQIYGLEKIKTIGDAYVAVSGLPQGNTSTAKDAVKLALSMQRVVKELNAERENVPFNLRIGLNTGDVVAGVVGSRKFQFDIWGDAVNIAARMEQNGEAGKVNVSHSTYEYTKDDFEFTYRGKVGAKNKGELDMYFVRLPDLEENKVS